MILEDTDETEEYNIFEAPIPTHRTLEYYSFRDNLVFTNIIAEMYTNIIGELFNENPELFISSDLKQDLDITRDQKGLRQSTALGSSFFMEANLSSKHKFERLKKVLRKFELEDSLIIKYKPK